MVLTRPDRTRIDMLTAALEAEYGPATDSKRVEIARAPGGVGLIGDDADGNEAFVLLAAIELDMWVAFRRRRDGLVRIASRHSRDAGSFWIDDLAPPSPVGASGGVRPFATADRALVASPAAAAGAAAAPSATPRKTRWSDYVAAIAWSLREAALPVRGFDGVVDSSIPNGTGLGSSAALELASAMALIGDRRLVAPPALAALAQRAERDYVGVDCGIVDQFASAAGRKDTALLLDCRSLEGRHVALPAGVRVVVCDTGSGRGTSTSVLESRRADCARAVALLAERIPGLCSLRDLDAATLRRHRAILPENVARRAEHVVSESARVMAAAAAMEAGDLDRLGRLFAASHASLRDTYEVSTPAIEAMLEVAGSIRGVVAARMTRSGVGACTVNLVLEDAVPALQAAVGRDYDRRTGLRGRVYPVAVVDGAGPLATT